MNRTNIGPALSQHGRAGVDALGAIQKFASSALRGAARDAYYADIEAQALRDALPPSDDRAAVTTWVTHAAELADRQPLYRLERFFQAYVALGIYDFGIPAIEERRAAFAASGKATIDESAIEYAPGIAVPAYFEADWHLRPGGWDGYDLYWAHGMHVVGPVFKLGGFAAVPVGGNIARHRLDVVDCLPQATYRRIYEPGCGNGATLAAIHARHPEAELIGSDLSPEQLRAAAALLQRSGIAATLRQRDAATTTREPDASVDAVVCFALQHELPIAANLALLVEMHRILAPGGDIVLSDPPPFSAIDPFHAALLDWDTVHRGEPYFSDALATDWRQALKTAGFIEPRAFALGPDSYPWVTIAHKPLEPVA
jgi:SAM-dependent methyltransferase